MMERIVFGPVPSRRLGQSLGINNIPFPKKCSYCCVYCQIGKTEIYEFERREFYKVDEIKRQVKEIIEKLKNKKINYISFVPDGEPTLDINLGKEIEALKEFGFKIAVISNSSLIWREDVRNDLKKADLVSLKVDTVNEEIWKKINRPFKNLKLSDILNGIRIFSREFKGKLITETMLIKNLNDNEKEIEKVADFLKEINPDTCYINYPSRPPAEKWVEVPEQEKFDIAYIIFKSRKLNSEIIRKNKGIFGFTGDTIKDILGIISVHPMSEKEIKDFLKNSKTSFEIIKKLVKERKISEIEYLGEKYYRRKYLRNKIFKISYEKN